MSQDAQLVERLCTAENPRERLRWEKEDGYYVATCRISDADVPGLIDIARQWIDPDWRPDTGELKVSEDTAMFLPVTAWRALADLKANDSVQPLIDLLCFFGDEFDEWSFEELPHIFGKLGESSMQPLMDLVNDEGRPRIARSAAVRGLRFVAEYHPEFRESVVVFLTQFMENAVENQLEFNATLLVELMDLKAVEAAESIERAFSQNLIDVGMCGDWESVRKELGVPGLGLPMPETPYNSFKELRDKLNVNGAIDALARHVNKSIVKNALALPKDLVYSPKAVPSLVSNKKVGRNDPCACGSGKKYKKCCGRLA